MDSAAYPRIACLILDLFGVLVAFDDRLVYDRIAQRCPAPGAAAERLRDLVSEPALIRGQVSLMQLHAELVRDVGLQATPAEFEALWRAPYAEPMPGMRPLLRELAGQCRLVLLSNVDPFHWPTVEACLPELAMFHARSLSFEMGVAKPEAEAFGRAVAASGLAIDACFFVDDKAENIAAAAALGLRSHHFRDCLGLTHALRAAGLRVGQGG